MANWRNPIVLEFAKQCGTDPVSALQFECRQFLLDGGVSLSADTARLPIDVDTLSRLAGIKGIKHEYGDIGTIARLEPTNDGKYFIRLNPKLNVSRYRYRFSIAHEIAHLIIRSKLTHPLSSHEEHLAAKYQYEEEQLSQYGASELLMPKELVAPFLGKQELTKESLTLLSKKFQVSFTAIVNRISYLLPNYIAIFWKYCTKPNASLEKLRIVWTYPKRFLKELPFIPLYATASDERFSPNLIQTSYLNGTSIHGKIRITKLGSLSGTFGIHIFNLHDSGLFLDEVVTQQSNNQRRFADLISLIELDQK